MPALGPLGPLGPQGPQNTNYRTQPNPPINPMTFGRGRHEDSQGRGPARTASVGGYNATQTSPANALSIGPAANPAQSAADRYEQQFKQSIVAARAGIERQLKLAMSELAQREGAAQGMIGQLPGQIDQQYAPTAGLLNQAAGTARSAVQAALSPQQSALATQVGDQTVAPIQAAIASGQAAQKSQVPLLQLGNSQLFSTQRNALQQAGLSANESLNQEERGYTMDRANTERAAALDAQNTAEERAYQERQAAKDFERQQLLKQADYTQQLTDEQRAAREKRPTFGRQEVTPDRGGDIARYQQPLAEQIRASKAYREQVRTLREAIQKNDFAKLDKYLRQKNRGKLPRTASLALFDTNALQLIQAQQG